MKDFFSQIFPALAVAIITALFKFVYDYLYKHTYKWKKIQLNSLPVDFKKDLAIAQSKYLIPVMGVNESNKNVNKKYYNLEIPLVEHFVKKELVKKNARAQKRYLVRAESGMGKTTFLVSLYYEYVRRYNEISVPYDMKVIPMSGDFISGISEIIHKERTILVLDALDECSSATNNYSIFFPSFDELIRIFPFVIITCRSQFFSSQKQEPDSFFLGGYVEKYEKFRILSFNEKQIKEYLINKYGLGSEGFYSAKKIVDETSDIASRPLILSFIDDVVNNKDIKNLLDLTKSDLGQTQSINIDSALLKTSENKISIFILYLCIVNAWFNRECNQFKVGIVPGSNDRFGIITKMFDFSKIIAYEIYKKWYSQSREMSITEDEYKEIESQYGFYKFPFSFADRSLLTTTDKFDIKFTHKSFWEFFLALYSFEHPEKLFNPHAFELSSIFQSELVRFNLQEIKFKFIHYPDFALNSNNHLVNVACTLQDTDSLSALLTNIWENFIINLKYYLKSLDNRTINQIYGQSLESLTYDRLARLDFLKSAEKILQFNQNVLSEINDLIDEIPALFLSKLETKSMHDIENYSSRIRALNNLIESTTDTSFVFKNKSILTFPSYKNSIAQQDYNIYDISVGLGFTNINEIIHTISSLIEKNTLLTIYMEKDTIYDIIDLFKNICKNLSFQNKNQNFIIFVLAAENKRITYVVTERNHNDDSVVSLLEAMFSYK